MLNRLKQGLTMYPGAEKTADDGLVSQLKEFRKGSEQWGLVTAIDEKKKRGWTRLHLEIHQDGLVYPNESYTRIPKGQTLAVGDHVAIVLVNQLTKSETFGLPGRMAKDEAHSEAAFELGGWLPLGPRAGTRPYARNGKHASWKINWGAEPQYGRAQPTQAEMTEAALAAKADDMPKPVEEVEKLRAAGKLSDAEAEQSTAYLEGRASVDDLHASGAMSDAHYAQAQRVRQEAIDRFAALRDAGTITEAAYQDAVASLG